MNLKINFKIIFVIILFYLSKQIEIYGLIMLFACIHELGHIISGIILGLKPKKVELMPLGLAVSFKVEANNYNKKIGKGSVLHIKKMIIAIAGPLTNFVLAFIFCKINFLPIKNIQEDIVYINLLIGIFNLLPIYPMDGGRILKEILHIKMGLKQSVIRTNEISNICIIVLTALASIAIYYFKNVSILLIIVYLWILVIMENKKYKMQMRIYNAIEK